MLSERQHAAIYLTENNESLQQIREILKSLPDTSQLISGVHIIA